MTESRSDEGKTPAIFQFSVGRNGDPLGKIKDFVGTAPSFADMDIAMIKICFVDLSRNSDAVAVAKATPTRSRTCNGLTLPQGLSR